MKRLKDDLVRYISSEEIDEMTSKIAKEIEFDYRGGDLLLVCPLKGSILFLADLCRKINLPQQIDFVQLTSTTEKEFGGNPTVKIVKDLTANIQGRHVLIVEEIIDAGRTLSFLKNRILSSAPASLKIVTLLDKPARRVINIKPDYVGRTIEDRFVIGYGMDDGELGRNYSDIYYLKH